MAQTAIETNFDNPLSRVNRSDQRIQPNSLFGKVKGTFKDQKQQYLGFYSDSLSRSKNRYRNNAALVKTSLNSEDRLDMILANASNPERMNELEHLLGVDTSTISNKYLDQYSGLQSDSLRRAYIQEAYLNNAVNDTLGLDSLLFSWQSDSLSSGLYQSQSIPDSVLFGSFIQTPDTLNGQGSFDLVNQFRGSNFSEKQLNHFKEYEGEIKAAGEQVRKLRFKDRITDQIKALGKNDFSNKKGEQFNRWKMSSFIEYDRSINAILLRPSLSMSISNRWRVGLLQAVVARLSDSKSITFGESGAFTEYDISKFFLHLEWNTTGLAAAEDQQGQAKENFLIGIGKPVTIKGVSGSLLLLYNTNSNEPQKFSFRYELNIF